MQIPYLTEEHEMLRDQLRRFIAEEVQPKADAWEEAGLVPREELGRSTYGGFAITVLVHTDMASPHLANYGDDDQVTQ